MGPVTSKMLARQARLLARLGAKVEGNAASAGVFGTPSQKNVIATEATFDYHPYKLHHLDEGPATSTTLTRDEGLRLYHQMVTVRRMETAAANLYKEKAIRGFCHLCSGQEAIYSGIGAGIRSQDSIITSYRAHVCKELLWWKWNCWSSSSSRSWNCFCPQVQRRWRSELQLVWRWSCKSGPDC